MKKLNFGIIETHNPQTIVFVDESKYTDSPVFPSLQIKFPDIERVYKCLITPEKVNAIYTTTVGFSSVCSDFPDGVYELRYSYEPHNTNYVCKKYMKVSKAYKTLKEILSEVSVKDEKYLEQITKIDLLLTASQLEVESNTQQSIEDLKLANKLLKKLSCNV